MKETDDNDNGDSSCRDEEEEEDDDDGKEWNQQAFDAKEEELYQSTNVASVPYPIHITQPNDRSNILISPI